MAGNFALSFSLNFLSIFVHISGAIRPITLIWVSDWKGLFFMQKLNIDPFHKWLPIALFTVPGAILE